LTPNVNGMSTLTATRSAGYPASFALTAALMFAALAPALRDRRAGDGRRAGEDRRAGEGRPADSDGRVAAPSH